MLKACYFLLGTILILENAKASSFNNLIINLPSSEQNPYFKNNMISVPALSSGKFLSGITAVSAIQSFFSSSYAWSISSLPSGWNLLSPQGVPISPSSITYNDPSEIILEIPGINSESSQYNENKTQVYSQDTLTLNVINSTFSQNLNAQSQSPFLTALSGSLEIQTIAYLMGENVGSNVGISPPYRLTGGKYLTSNTTLPNIFYSGNNLTNYRPSFVTAQVKFSKPILGTISVQWNIQDSNSENSYNAYCNLETTQSLQGITESSSTLFYNMDTTSSNLNNNINISTLFSINNSNGSFYVGYLCFYPNSSQTPGMPYNILPQPFNWSLLQPSVQQGNPLLNIGIPKKGGKTSLASANFQITNAPQINSVSYEISIIPNYPDNLFQEWSENSSLLLSQIQSLPTTSKGINLSLSKSKGNYIDLFNGITLTLNANSSAAQGKYYYILRAIDQTGFLVADYPFFVQLTSS